MNETEETPEPEPTSEEETAAILADPETLAAIAEGEAELTPEQEAEPPSFNPLQTWDQLVAELGDPTTPRGSVLGIPEEDLDR